MPNGVSVAVSARALVKLQVAGTKAKSRAQVVFIK